MRADREFRRRGFYGLGPWRLRLMGRGLVSFFWGGGKGVIGEGGFGLCSLRT